MKKSSLSSNVKAFKKEFETLVKKIQSQGGLNDLIKSVPKEINKIVDNDLVGLKKKVLKEKEVFIKTIDKKVYSELKKVKKFVDTQRKEIDKLQKKVEKFVKDSGKKTKKKATKKKVVKKAAKKVTKKATKKTTKKVVK